MCSSSAERYQRSESWIAVLIAALLGGMLRFYNLNWDEGHFLHPDERLYINASSLAFPSSWAEFFSAASPMNPHMFYYGSLPLYLYVAVQWALRQIVGGGDSLLVVSRAVSAIISVLTVILLYRVSRLVLSERAAALAAMLLAFSVGSIQAAHFNTTESLLALYGVLFLLLGSQIAAAPKGSLFPRPAVPILLSAALLGIAFATKVTGLSFGIIPLVGLLIYLVRNWTEQRPRDVWLFALVGVGAVSFVLLAGTAFLGAPYNFIDYPSFYREQEYMQGVILGTYKPPFTIIYEQTPSLLYHLTAILPWITSPLTALLFCLGIGLFAVDAFLRKQWLKLMFLAWPVVYLLTVGFWYAKFTRYMIPLLPFVSLFAAYLIDRLQRSTWPRLVRGLASLTIALHVFYSVAFVAGVYGEQHTRIRASEYIYLNLPAGSRIATEHWDDGLPLPRPEFRREAYETYDLAVYDQDTVEKARKLMGDVARADYLALSSRRVYASILRNPSQYPFTSQFYRELFAERLGFSRREVITGYPRLFGLTLNTDSADESFQSYDHPPVIILENKEHRTPEELGRSIGLSP